MKQTIVTAAAAFAALAQAAPSQLAARDSNYISSCGDNWMARDDVSSNHGEIARRGYLSAVSDFCKAADGKTVPAGGYLSMATRVYLDGGDDPKSNGQNGYVYFEVHNKQKNSTSHQVKSSDCQDHFKQLSNDKSKCWGSKNSDTKGGTWEVGNDAVSYHALGNYVIPTQQDAVDKLYTQGPLTKLTGSNGTALSPWPLHFTSDVTPVPCHSHNDYTRNIPLFDALSAGCLSVEGDVWIHGENLRIGHTDPGDKGPTLEQLYLDPIKAMLDASNGTIYPKNSTGAFVLLVDMKGDGNSTWDLLVKKLQPLRDAKYLSYWDGSKFVQGAVTVVGSGNAPLSSWKVSDHVFIDAKINEDLSKNNASNSYYASAKFSDAIGSNNLDGKSLQKMKGQIAAAHQKGLKVRYYEIPDLWQELFDQGVDRINVDDLAKVAGMDWHLPAEK